MKYLLLTSLLSFNVAASVNTVLADNIYADNQQKLCDGLISIYDTATKYQKSNVTLRDLLYSVNHQYTGRTGLAEVIFAIETAYANAEHSVDVEKGKTDFYSHCLAGFEQFEIKTDSINMFGQTQ